MKNFLIYAMNYDESHIMENINNIFHGRNFLITENKKNFIIVNFKKLFGSESFSIKITDNSDPAFLSMKETAMRHFSGKQHPDFQAVSFTLSYIEKTEAFIEIKCEKDYSGLLDELFIKLTSSFNGAALLDNDILIDFNGEVILFADGTPGDSVLIAPEPESKAKIYSIKIGLPKISLPESFTLPSKDEIIGRACAHLVISGYASDVTMAEPIHESREFYSELIKKYEIEEYLTEEESSLLYRDNLSITECFSQIGNFDKAAVLMWFLSLIDEQILLPYEKSVKYHVMMQTFASFEDFDALFDNSNKKSSGELLNLADKLHAAHSLFTDESSLKTIENKYAAIQWLCGEGR